MKPIDIAYEIGVRQARRDHEKRATVRSFLNTLAGRNVGKALSEQHQRIMKLPFVVQQAKRTPRDMSTFESYITKALKGGERYTPGLEDLSASARKAKGRKDLIETLTQGQGIVKTEQVAALKARLGLGGAVALPAAGSAVLSSGEKTGAIEDVGDVAPAVAAGTMGASPIVQGLRSGALGLPEAKGQQVKNVETLQKMLKPGDMLLTSKPGISGVKPLVAAVGGDPFGYHVESVTKTPKAGPSFIHSTPAEGGAFRYGPYELSEAEDVIIKRFKDPAHTKKYLENLNRFGRKEDVLEKMLGPYARKQMYDFDAARRAGLKSFVPKFLQRLIGSGTPAQGATICSSLPGLCSPVELAHGVPAHEILPHHIQRSPALKTVSHLRVPRTIGQGAVEGLLRASPWLLRGALGAGLGYGAYRGIKALTD